MLVMNGLIRPIGSGERQFGGVGSIQSLSLLMNAVIMWWGWTLRI